MIRVTAPSGCPLPVAPRPAEIVDARRLGRDLARLAAESPDGAVGVQQLAEAGWTPDQLDRLALHGSAYAARRLAEAAL